MFDITPPEPVEINQKVSGCSIGIELQANIYWRDAWKDIVFECIPGKRDIRLNVPMDCEGCQFHTPGLERG